MKNKIFELFVCMLLMGTFFVVTLVAVSADQDGDYTYTVSNGEATITKYTGAGGAITIPSRLGGYPTVIIGDNAFNACTFLTSVIIPNNITTIGNKAFKYCTSLTSIIIPNNVTTIGDYTFYSCDSLASVTIGKKVTTIGNSTFDYCSTLTSVTIGNNVTVIGNNAFEHCSALTSLTIPDSVITIGNYAFWFCSTLTSVTIGNRVKTIGAYAFSSCAALTSLTIPDNVTTIGNSAFDYCSALTSVTIGNRVKTIGTYAFNSCSALTSITFLGLAEPTFVGINWIKDTPAEIRGHAYAASHFPTPGGMLDFYGLKMGTVISVENILPFAGFTWTPSNITLNQTVTFNASISNDSDGSLTLYEWDWNNDGVYEESHTTPTATHSWTQAGDYPVIVQVTDNDGATNTQTKTVYIANTPITPASPKTPGFELILVISAIAFVFFLKIKGKKSI
jgi:BspA type Leucine rich repeat region (6 copies)/PKD domain